MAAYRLVYDSRHLQADCQGPDQLRNPTLGYRVWATFTFFYLFSYTEELTNWGQSLSVCVAAVCTLDQESRAVLVVGSV